MEVLFPTQTVAHQSRPAATTQYRLHQMLGLAERALDFLVIVTALAFASVLHGYFRPQKWMQYSGRELLVAAAAYALLFVILLDRHGEYRPYVSLLWVRETERLLRVTLQSSVCLLMVYCLAAPVSRMVFFFAVLTVPASLTIEKWVTRRAIRFLRSRRYGTRKVVVLGIGSLGRQIYSVLARSPKFGLEPIGFVSAEPQEWDREIYECSYQRKSPARVLPGQPSPQLLQELGATVLVVATQYLSQDAILRWVTQFSAQGITVYFAPAEFFESGVRIEYAEIDGILLGHASGEDTRAVYETAKRLLDIGLSAVSLVLFAPLFIALAVLVKASSPGPVIFRQNRIGKDGQTFPMLKFRSMVVDAPSYAFSPTEDEDPRITTIGRFLRRTSLDELPQIGNVSPQQPAFCLEYILATHRD